MTDTQPSGAESALDLDKTIWDAVTRLERQDSTYEQRIAAADGLRALARRATAPPAGPAPAAATMGEVFKSVGGWMNGGDLGYPSFGSMEALQKYTIKSIRAYLAAQPVEAGSAVQAQLVPGAHPAEPVQEKIEFLIHEITGYEGEDDAFSYLRRALSELMEFRRKADAVPVGGALVASDEVPDSFKQAVYALLEHVTALLFVGLDYSPAQSSAKEKIRTIMRQAMSDEAGKELLRDLCPAAAPAGALVASAELGDIVTRESALVAIRHVAESREPGKTIRAAHMLVAPAGAPSGEMSKAEIDEIVYQCRQSGKDTTYDIVNAALASRATESAAAPAEQTQAARAMCWPSAAAKSSRKAGRLSMTTNTTAANWLPLLQPMRCATNLSS